MGLIGLVGWLEQIGWNRLVDWIQMEFRWIQMDSDGPKTIVEALTSFLDGAGALLQEAGAFK